MIYHGGIFLKLSFEFSQIKIALHHRQKAWAWRNKMHANWGTRNPQPPQELNFINIDQSQDRTQEVDFKNIKIFFVLAACFPVAFLTRLTTANIGEFIGFRRHPFSEFQGDMMQLHNVQISTVDFTSAPALNFWLTLT